MTSCPTVKGWQNCGQENFLLTNSADRRQFFANVSNRDDEWFSPIAKNFDHRNQSKQCPALMYIPTIASRATLTIGLISTTSKICRWSKVRRLDIPILQLDKICPQGSENQDYLFDGSYHFIVQTKYEPLSVSYSSPISIQSWQSPELSFLHVLSVMPSSTTLYIIWK